MRRVTTSTTNRGRGVPRLLAAGALACSLAVLGCTTNHTPGNGQPYTGTPSVPTMPSSTPGSSSGTAGNPPMASSSSDAAAIMQAHQGHTPVYLGQAFPAIGLTQQNAPAPTGQFQNPALVANPYATVNSSISSSPVPV